MADVGTVRYEVELDDSNIDQQASKTEKKITSKFGDIAKKGLSAAGKGLAIGSAALVGGTVAIGKSALDLASNVAKAGDEIDKMSQKVGFSREAYQEWNYVFERNGASIEGLQVGMKTLSGVISDAGNGATGAADKLAAIGLTYDDLKDKTPEEQFAMVVEQLQNMEEGADRTAAASDLLGKSATDMAAIFNSTAEDTRALIDETHKYGMIMSDEAVLNAAAYEDAMTKLDGTINGLKTSLGAALLPALTDVINGMADVANGSKDAGTVIGEAIGSLADTIQEKIPDVIDKGAEIVSGLVGGITDHLPDLLDCAGTLIGELAHDIAENLPTVLDSGGQILTSLIEGVLKLLPDLATAALEIIVALGKYIVEKTPELVTDVATMVGKLVQYIIDKAPEMGKAALEVITKLGSGITQYAGNLVTSAGDIVDQLWDTITSFDWRSVAGDIIDGIKEGFHTFGDNVKEGAGELKDKAVSGLKRVFKSNSPSKLMRDEVGKTIPEGIAVGIEENTDSVLDSLDNLTADMNYHLPDLSGATHDLGASLTASSSTQINVPVVIDGREVARATAWYTNEQLAWESR